MQENNNISDKKSAKIDLVILLKVLIILVILIVPITFILMDLTNQYYNLKVDNKTVTQSGQEFDENGLDFEAPVLNGSETDISNVPKEEIDTLFDNLED